MKIKYATVNESDEVAETLLLLAIGIAIGALIGWFATWSAWEYESVRLDYAEYSQATGEWQWKEQKK